MEKEGLAIIAVVGKELFPVRMHLEETFAHVLYDQLIFVLENIAKEVEEGFPDRRIGVYLDSKNPGTRKFELPEEGFYKVCDLFGHKFHGEVKQFGLRQQEKGTDILYQLNEGTISVSDFKRSF